MPNRQAMIEALAGKVTIDEPGLLVNNGLSTNIICFPSDMDPTRRKFLRKKIYAQLETTAAFGDIAELNALMRLPPRVPDNCGLLGLYLYFADECSRLGKDKTFLTALREAGATLKVGVGYDRVGMLTKARNALTNLGMENKHFDLLDEWFRTGNYTIEGELNTRDHSGASIGTYARLAEKMSPDGKRIGINQAISFAVANKDKIKRLSPEQAFTRTKELLKDPREIKSLVKQGDKTRIDRLMTAIAGQKKEGNLPKPATKRGDNLQPREVLSLLPDSILELLYREEYMFAYAHQKDIRSIFPKEDLPGISFEENERTRNGIAARQSQYNMIFLSNGNRFQNPGDVDRDGNLRNKVVTQALLHEAAHLALNYLHPLGIDWHMANAINPLRDTVKAVSQELAQKEWEGSLPPYFYNTLQTLDITTLSKLVDYTSRNYSVYSFGNTDNGFRDSRWEEVVCQVTSLMYTEFPYPPEAGKPNPYADLPSLGKLAQSINTALETARTKCREEHPDIKLPSTSLPGH